MEYYISWKPEALEDIIKKPAVLEDKRIEREKS